MDAWESDTLGFMCGCDGGGGHKAVFNSSIQAFTFQMLIAVPNPSPLVLLTAQPPTAES